MGIRDWFRRNLGGLISSEEFSSGRGKIPRFAPVSENDEMLLPQQITFMKAIIDSVSTEVLALQDPRIDEMLPECSFFIPNLLAEFNDNPNLAMIHGLGIAHAWIDTMKLREILAARSNHITNYRSLFQAFRERGYDVKKIKYISFRSRLGKR